MATRKRTKKYELSELLDNFGLVKKLAIYVKHALLNQLCVWFLASKHSIVKSRFESEQNTFLANI